MRKFFESLESESIMKLSKGFFMFPRARHRYILRLVACLHTHHLVVSDEGSLIVSI